VKREGDQDATKMLARVRVQGAVITRAGSAWKADREKLKGIYAASRALTPRLGSAFRSFCNVDNRVALRGDGKVEVSSAMLNSTALEEYLELHPGEELRGLERAADVGSYVLLRSNRSFTTRKISESLKGHLEQEVSKSVGALLSQTEKLTKAKLDEVRQVLQQDMDPNNKESTIGKVLGSLNDLLDPNRTDSIPANFSSALQETVSREGQMATLVNEAVEKSMLPLREQLKSLSSSLQAQQLSAGIIQGSPKKGFHFEDEILHLLGQWKQGAGAQVEHCGPDLSQGDILVTMDSIPGVPNSGFTAVIEAKDKVEALGRSRLIDTAKEAIAARGVQCGIVLCKNEKGLGKAIGDWDEGFVDGAHWIATTPEHLTTSLRYAAMTYKLRQHRATMHESVDAERVEAGLVEIRNLLKKTSSLKRKATQIRKLADSITSTTSELSSEVSSVLGTLERDLNLREK